jgi:hypothetical protein
MLAKETLPHQESLLSAESSEGVLAHFDSEK